MSVDCFSWLPRFPPPPVPPFPTFGVRTSESRAVATCVLWRSLMACVYQCDGAIAVEERCSPCHPSPGLVRFMMSCTGHRVTSPDPLGNWTPDNASRTELFPQDWSPITAICWKRWKTNKQQTQSVLKTTLKFRNVFLVFVCQQLKFFAGGELR